MTATPTDATTRTATAARTDADTLELCPPRGWRSQFAHPRGLLGRLAGAVMASKNAVMNDAALARLPLGPEDRVLEIGFGHGRTLAALAARVPRGRATGVDPSEAMLAMASRRLRAAVAAAELRLASAEQLPFPDASFDAAYAANSVQFWPGPERSMREVRRVLRPGGTLLLAIRLHEDAAGRFASPGFRASQVDDVGRRLAASGFAVRREDARAGRALALLFAVRPAP